MARDLAHANCTLCCALKAQRRTGSNRCKKIFFGWLMNVFMVAVK